MYQEFEAIGNVGKVDMRYTPSGVPVTSFSVAINKHWTSQDGQRQEKTTWINCTAWRKLAEITGQYLVPGKQVFIKGEIEEPRAYMAKDGEPRASIECTVSIVKFLGNRQDGPAVHGAPVAGDVEPGFGEADIPF